MAEHTEHAGGRRGRLGAPMATFAAWVAVGLVNNVVVGALVTASAGWSSAALLHHLYDLGYYVAAGLTTSLAVAALTRWAPRRLLRLGYVLLALAAVVLGAATLVDDLEPMSQRLGERAPPWLLLWGSLLAVTGGVPLAALAGRLLRRPWWRIAGLALAVGGQVSNAFVLQNDYPGAHLFLGCAVVAFLASVLAGARLPARASPALELATASWHRTLLVLGPVVAAAVASIAVCPPGSVVVRFQRCSGSFLQPFISRVFALSSGAAADVPPTAIEWFLPRADVAPVPASTPTFLPDNAVVVLVSIEAFRADVARGPEHDEQLPNLSRLREKSLRFTNARANGTQTVYTLTTLFAGTYFSQQYWTRTPVRRHLWPHADPTPRFPELLTKAGVSTVCFAGVDWLVNDLGIVGGFREDPWVRDGARVFTRRGGLTNRLTRRLGHVRDDERAFLFTHYFDSHAPYESSGLQGTAFERYLGELSLIDEELGRVIALLDSRFPGRGYLIVIGDHGEAFGEHNSSKHATTMYEEGLRIPLMIHGPGIAPREVTEPVALVDLGPTILDMFGLPTPPHFMGQSLVPFARGGDVALTRPFFAEGRLVRTMIFDDGMKVIENSRQNLVELYDLRHDPGELTNLADDSSLVAQPLGMLRRFLEVHRIRREGYQIPLRR